MRQNILLIAAMTVAFSLTGCQSGSTEAENEALRRQVETACQGEALPSVLEVDMGTVKSRISRARGALRKILQESGNLSGYLPSKPTEIAKKGGGR